jgi:hypothetical protein
MSERSERIVRHSALGSLVPARSEARTGMSDVHGLMCGAMA